MADYYLRPDAVGADDGTDWDNAWTTLQRAVDGTGGTQPGLGDRVLMRGSETLAATVDLDGTSGTIANYVKFIGTNGAGVIDGTCYGIDASGGAYKLLFSSGTDFLWLENVDLTGGVGVHGVQIPSGSDRHVLANVLVHGAGNRGFSIAGSARAFRCAAYGNGAEGIYATNDFSKVLACRASGNGSYGMQLDGDGVVAIGCLSYENTLDAFYLENRACTFFCIGDANLADGFEVVDSGSLIWGCRATNNVNGVDVAAGQRALIGLLYTGGNSGTELDADYDELLFQAAASKVTAGGGDTDHGYVDSASDDLNLDADEATYYSEECQIP